MFQERAAVRLSECDGNGQMTLMAIINRMQDISCIHCLTRGYGVFRTRSLGVYWVLLSWDIDVMRYPYVDEDITTNVYVQFRRRHFSMRSFEIMDGNGDVIARATSNWCTCDTKENRIAIIPQELIDSMPQDDSMTMPNLPLANKLESLNYTPVSAFPVQPCHLDVNRHVNNAQYLRFVTDVLDPSTVIRKLRIYYSAAAWEGETLTLSSCEEDGSTVYKTSSADTNEIKTIMQIWKVE